MQLDAYEIAIIGMGGTIVGSLIGAWIGYRLSLQLSTIAARQKASQKFVSTFHRELSDVYPYPIKWPDNIVDFLESKFTVLNAATGEFRHYLPSKDWAGFDKAWFSYYCATDREIDMKNCQCYHHYMAFESNPRYKGNFKCNVDNLLKYAKIT